MRTYLDVAELSAALSLPDLTLPDLTQPTSRTPHAIALVLQRLTDTLRRDWCGPMIMVRDPALVSVAHNYDRLGFAPDDVTRERRYSRYVSPTVMLRSHTTAAIPQALDDWDPHVTDGWIVAAGLAYRRDSVDRTHVGAPHQADLWRISKRVAYGPDDLAALAELVVSAVRPGTPWRLVERSHPYTIHGQQLDLALPGPHGTAWLELGECGVVAPRMLSDAGLNPDYWTGLAFGLGLDRAVMITKGIDDIRLLRSPDPRVAAQLHDLAPYRPVSRQPAIRRDLSIVAACDVDVETLGDDARAALGDRTDVLEEIVIVARTPYDLLPEAARRRLKITPSQVDLLVRLTMRPLVGTLTDAEANRLRDRVYRAVHTGPVAELTGSG